MPKQILRPVQAAVPEAVRAGLPRPGAVSRQRIPGPDGLGRCYYFNREDGSLYGALLMNGTTPDGYTVDETGAWTENGTAVTKAL